MSQQQKKTIKKILPFILLFLFFIGLWFFWPEKDAETEKLALEEPTTFGVGSEGSDSPASLSTDLEGIAGDTDDNIEHRESDDEEAYPAASPYTKETPSPSGEKSFTLHVGLTPWDNTLTIDGTDVEIKEVAMAKWSQDEQYILYSLVEGEKHDDEHTDILDSGNIWSISSTGTNQTQLYNSGTLDAIDYVATNDRVAFVSTTQVGTVTTDGSNLQILHTFTPDFPVPGIISTPSIRLKDNTSFEVDLPTGLQTFPL